MRAGGTGSKFFIGSVWPWQVTAWHGTGKDCCAGTKINRCNPEKRSEILIWNKPDLDGNAFYGGRSPLRTARLVAVLAVESVQRGFCKPGLKCRGPKKVFFFAIKMKAVSACPASARSLFCSNFQTLPWAGVGPEVPNLPARVADCWNGNWIALPGQRKTFWTNQLAISTGPPLASARCQAGRARMRSRYACRCGELRPLLARDSSASTAKLI